MADHNEAEHEDQALLEAQKRVRKIKKFYKDLAQWAGTSVILIAVDIFFSGSLTWSRYPVFFWGIFVAAEYFNVLRLQRLDKDWEERQLRRFRGNTPLPTETPTPAPPSIDQKPIEDYSEELLPPREREMADLKDYRRLKRPWKDEDLV